MFACSVGQCSDLSCSSELVLTGAVFPPNAPSIHPSTHPYTGPWGRQLEPIPAYTGRRQVTPWTGHAFMNDLIVVSVLRDTTFDVMSRPQVEMSQLQPPLKTQFILSPPRRQQEAGWLTAACGTRVTAITVDAACYGVFPDRRQSDKSRQDKILTSLKPCIKGPAIPPRRRLGS